MKIVAINGSPRSLGTASMLKAVCSGSDYGIIDLCKVKMKHCAGCCTCETTGKCQIDDGVAAELEKLASADAIVIGCPTYFNNVTGLLKDFMDRTLPLWPARKLKGKKTAICVIGGDSGDSQKDAVNIIKTFCEIHEMDVVGSVIAPGSNPKAVEKELKQLGKKLVK